MLEGVIPVLAQLLEQNESTRSAYLCHPCVQHVSKLKKEGMVAFCDEKATHIGANDT